MLNRRYVRIKTMQALYAYWQQPEGSVQQQRTFYEQGIQRLGQAYLSVLELLPTLLHLAELAIERQRQKNYFSDELLKPYLPVTTNLVFSILGTNPALKRETQLHSISWQLQFDRLEPLFEHLRQTDFYKQQAERPAENFKQQKEFTAEVCKWLIAESEQAASLLEERYIGWNDDEPVVYVNVLKTIDSISEEGQITLLNVPGDDYVEIKQFGLDLLEKTILHHEEFEAMIAAKTPNWEADRIASTDQILMKMALAEFLYFDSIPIKVTINEYMELSKLYSTPRSYQFINGVLDGLQKDLTTDGKITKKGRGLVG